MMEVNTALAIQYCLVLALCARDLCTIFQAYVSSSHIFDATWEQDQIGWKHFVKGRVSRWRHGGRYKIIITRQKG